jgi:preprotein translocase subunit SecD
MLYFTRWKALAIILTALVVCLCAVPNFFPEAKVKTWPLWAQRHLVLGLDLQGGSYLLLEVDSNYVKKEKLDQVRDDVRRVLRENKIGYTGLASRADYVEVRVKESDAQTALAKLRELSQPLDPPGRAAGGRHRSHPADDRAIDPDRRAPGQPAWHGRARDSAAGHRPHSGAGAGPAGSD